MQADAELCYLPATALDAAFASGQLSPIEVTEAYLRRIEQHDDRLHTYITMTADRALQAAEASARRRQAHQPLSRLDGVPFGLKDLFDTAGIRTTGHSALYANRIPDRDATVVRRLADAGAVLLGKHAMHELAYGEPGPDVAFPPARNPWNPELMPGGSSSGSAAAVAAGLCAVAVGSDTGGSIRAPSSYCGIVGLKPTYGLISRVGMIPVAWSLDQAGPMTRTVQDAAWLLEALAGVDPADPTTARRALPNAESSLHRPVRGLRIGVPMRYLEAAPDLTDETKAALHASLATFQDLGADVQSIDLPGADVAQAVVGIIIGAEAFTYHRQDALERPGSFGADFYAKLLQGSLHSASDYINAQRGRTEVCHAMAEAMQSIDLIVTPTTVRQASAFDSGRTNPIWIRTSLTRIFSLTGQPALSVPCGFSSAGLPIGLQIVGRPFQDDLVLAAGHAFERARGTPARRPPLD